jgi:hypothetical protein
MSPQTKKLAAQGILIQLRAARSLLEEKIDAAGSARSSWSLRYEFSQSDNVTGIAWTDVDEKTAKKVSVSYATDIQILRKDVEKLEDSLLEIALDECN